MTHTIKNSMHYPLDYQPTTPRDRDQSLTWFRQQARICVLLIERQNDPTKTPLAPVYDRVLIKLLDSYRETIKRITEMQNGFRKVNP